MAKRKYSGAAISRSLKRARLTPASYTPPRRGGVARQVATMAGRALFGATPVGRVALGAYDTYRALRGPGVRARRERMGKYHTTARYAGKFKKKAMKYRAKTSPYLTRGFKNTTEVSGTVSDPDCVYVGHSTTNGHRILTLFLQCTLRKLFSKGVKWSCTNVAEPIRGYQNASDGYRLIMTRKNIQTGVETDVTYDTIVSDSIARIVGDNATGVAPAWPDLYNFWVNYIGGASGTVTGAVDQPTRLSLYQRDGNITNFYHFLGDVYWPNEKIHMFIKSDLKIQNRTLSATGNSDAEDITNNPLIGKLYEFSVGCPRARVEGVNIIEGVLDSTGVITKRAAEFTAFGSTVMREPPEAQIFNNVRKVGKVMLQPGNIKSDTIVFKIQMGVYRFFERLDWRFNSGGFATAVSMKMMGKCSLFALEDQINVNVAQNISIAYEANRVEMMYLSTNSVKPAQGSFYQQTQSNNPT